MINKGFLCLLMMKILPALDMSYIEPLAGTNRMVNCYLDAKIIWEDWMRSIG